MSAVLLITALASIAGMMILYDEKDTLKADICAGIGATCGLFLLLGM